MLLPILLSVLFFGLGVIHFNWALGGKFGFAHSLPTRENGERVLNPKRIDSAIVGMALTAFGVFYLVQSGIIQFPLPGWVIQYGGWIIPILFILRAMGEFKYIGFFKRVKRTEFGKMDTKFYSPLCLAIGVLGIIIKLMA